MGILLPGFGWTTPRTWVTGEVVTAAQLNQQIRDNLNAIDDSGRFLFETQVTTSDAEIEFSSIPQTARNLCLEADLRSSSGAVVIDMLVNNLTSNLYYTQGLNVTNTTITGYESLGGASARIGAMGAAANRWNGLVIYFFDYAEATKDICWMARTCRSDGNNTGNQYIELATGYYDAAQALTTIDLMANGAAVIETGSTFSLYGCN